MSLLEDIFLRDEANEAKELERIIEGDEYDDKPQLRSDSDDNSEKEDEAEEEKRRVDPSSTKTKRAVKNPRFILNPARLTGPRGIQVIPDHFKDFIFKGKGHEKEDLDFVLKKLEHWAYRLYPKFKFEDCLKKIETLGKKRPVMVHLHKLRSDQYISEETVVQKDSSDDEIAPMEREEDEFDKLLQQQIDLARSTPGPGSVKKHPLESSVIDRSSNAPKVTSSPSMSEVQRERMLRSRKLAEDRRLARLKDNGTVSINRTLTDKKETNDTADTYTESLARNTHFEQAHDAHAVVIIDTDDVTQTRKHKKTNFIDSTDDEDGVMSVSEPVTVDVHTILNNGIENSDSNARKLSDENKTVDDFSSIPDDVTESNKKQDSAEMQSLYKSNLAKSTNCGDTKMESRRQNFDSINKVDDMETQLNVDETKILNNKVEMDSSKENSNQNKIAAIATNLERNSGSVADKTTSYLEQTETIRSTIDTDENLVTPDENIAEITDHVQHTINAEEVVKIKESEIQESAVTNENKEIKLNEDISKDLDDDLMDVDFSEDF